MVERIGAEYILESTVQGAACVFRIRPHRADRSIPRDQERLLVEDPLGDFLIFTNAESNRPLLDCYRGSDD